MCEGLEGQSIRRICLCLSYHTISLSFVFCGYTNWLTLRLSLLPRFDKVYWCADTVLWTISEVLLDKISSCSRSTVLLESGVCIFQLAFAICRLVFFIDLLEKLLRAFLTKKNNIHLNLAKGIWYEQLNKSFTEANKN